MWIVPGSPVLHTIYKEKCLPLDNFNLNLNPLTINTRTALRQPTLMLAVCIPSILRHVTLFLLSITGVNSVPQSQRSRSLLGSLPRSLHTIQLSLASCLCNREGDTTLDSTVRGKIFDITYSQNDIALRNQKCQVEVIVFVRLFFKKT